METTRAHAAESPASVGKGPGTKRPRFVTGYDNLPVVASDEEAGSSIETAAYAYSVMDSSIYGFALQQLTLVYDTSEHAGKVAQTFLRQFRADEYPTSPR